MPPKCPSHVNSWGSQGFQRLEKRLCCLQPLLCLPRVSYQWCMPGQSPQQTLLMQESSGSTYCPWSFLHLKYAWKLFEIFHLRKDMTSNKVGLFYVFPGRAIFIYLNEDTHEDTSWELLQYRFKATVYKNQRFDLRFWNQWPSPLTALWSPVLKNQIWPGRRDTV